MERGLYSYVLQRKIHNLRRLVHGGWELGDRPKCHTRKSGVVVGWCVGGFEVVWGEGGGRGGRRRTGLTWVDLGSWIDLG